MDKRKEARIRVRHTFLVQPLELNERASEAAALNAAGKGYPSADFSRQVLERKYFKSYHESKRPKRTK